MISYCRLKRNGSALNEEEKKSKKKEYDKEYYQKNKEPKRVLIGINGILNMNR